MSERPGGTSAVGVAAERFEDRSCRPVFGAGNESVPVERTLRHQPVQVRMPVRELAIGAGDGVDRIVGAEGVVEERRELLEAV